MGGTRRWDTPEKIAAAMDELADTMPGWKPPAAHGVVLVPPRSLGTSDVRFPVVNVGAHGLPALVMGSITGRRAETATYEVDPAELARGVTMLEPAEAARMYQHPNLKTPGARSSTVSGKSRRPGSLPCSSHRSMRP